MSRILKRLAIVLLGICTLLSLEGCMVYGDHRWHDGGGGQRWNGGQHDWHDWHGGGRHW